MLERCFPLMRRGPTASRRTESEGAHPQLIRPRGHKAPLHAIKRLSLRLVRNGCARPATAHNASEAFLAHQSLDRAARHRNVLPVQLSPHLARSIGPEILLPHAPDRATQPGI